MGNYATEIQNIATILKKNRLCSDTSPLTNGYNNGKCNVAKLKFNISNVPRNTKPAVDFLAVILDVAFDEKTGTDIPVTNYFFKVTVEGLDGSNKVKSSWHLDYDSNNGQDYVHPYFHLTWGGDTIKKMNLGNVLLLPTPRISHPPMDIVLGIDFVLSNFVKAEIYKRIQSNSQYKAAVRKAQEKLWKPYMLSLAHHWCKNTCSNVNLNTITATNFHPTLV